MEIKKRSTHYIKKNIFHIILLLFLIIAYFITPYVPSVSAYQDKLSTLLIILLYILSGWILSRVLNYTFAFTLNKKFSITKSDNLYERKMQTKLRYISATINVAIWFIVTGLILSLFDKLKIIGSSILVSAGILGIIIGFAAQKPISNLISGFQIAFTHPIAIDDVVVVEGEWGVIEEMTLTYVVVRIWDKRRLILPISYFVEKPFQNWTKTSADILGTVLLYTDYAVPIEKLRTELSRILKKTDLWDGKTGMIQVTATTEKCIELRVLVSARNSSDAWNLRCDIREKLIEYIRKNYPESLPVTRAEIKKN